MHFNRALQVMLVLFFVQLLQMLVYGQDLPVIQTNGSRLNSVQTAVPFLLISPDARTGSMGEAGVAVKSDGNTTSINPAKLAFVEGTFGFAVSYSPWLKNFGSDINLGYLSGFFQIDQNSTIGTSLRYFSLGQIQLRDVNQQDLGMYSPSEYAIDATYARRFGDSFSLGTSLRYVYSNLAGGQISGTQQISAGKSLAMDVSAYVKKPAVLFGYQGTLAAGANISNIGTKMSYSAAGQDYFLPTNLKIGGAASIFVDDNNEFTFALDFNKLLVPTRPLYDAEGNIVSGKDTDRSVPAGIFGSFADAPGGLNEELKEINVATGMEYWYDQKFALRTGYFYESPAKGGRRYFTLGAGFKYEAFVLNISYLIANAQKSPLANTLRFSLLFSFGANQQ
jgi:hypothetical protein